MRGIKTFMSYNALVECRTIVASRVIVELAHDNRGRELRVQRVERAF